MEPWADIAGANVWTGAVIQWPAGGAVLPAAYEPAPNFKWDYMVNVVKVQLTESTVTCYQNNTPTELTDSHIVYFQDLTTNPTTPTMLTMATVTITGATAWDGSIRGVKYIDVGFIQFITPQVWTYNGGGKTHHAASWVPSL